MRCQTYFQILIHLVESGRQSVCHYDIVCMTLQVCMHLCMYGVVDNIRQVVQANRVRAPYSVVKLTSPSFARRRRWLD